MQYIDLTRLFTATMPVYPGDPVPELVRIADIVPDGYTDYRINTGMHVGTHMDAPLHMIEHGKYLSEMNIERFFGKGHLIDARAKDISADLLEGRTIHPGDMILLFTGCGEKFGSSEYYEQYPEVSEDFARKAVELGVSIVGMDTPSPDRSPFNVHKILLGNDILIIENLTNLENLIDVKDFEVIALPAKFQTEAAPVRVIVRTQ